MKNINPHSLTLPSALPVLTGQPLLLNEVFFMEEIEIWKDVKGYEGIYEVSSFGNVRSLPRTIKHSRGTDMTMKGKLLANNIGKIGYCHVTLCKYGTRYHINIHQLVAEAFLNHTSGTTMVVNHINLIKPDNRLENLEIVTFRENTSFKHIKHSSIYTGVSYYKSRNKYRARMKIKSKLIDLGWYTNEIDASNAYEDAVKKLNNK